MNDEIRAAAKEKKVKLWQIAEQLGLADCNFSRKLRRELPEEEKDNILSIITRIAAGEV